MNDSGPRRLLLGPQRPNLNLAEAIAASGINARTLAVISAGWQEAENDIDDVREIVGLPLTDLCLYGRAEALLNANTALADDYRARQERLKEQQRLYRLRLKQLAIAARQTLSASSQPDIIRAERRHAVAQLRALDRHHLTRTEVMQSRFAAAYNEQSVPEIAEHRREIAAVLDASDAVLITGGDIAVLLNRMRLFDIGGLLADKPIIGWSAGAMVLATRIVLYHDRMPQGRRDAEVLGAGLGLISGYVVLPDPAGRMRERDRPRIGLMARRFSPEHCITLDSGSALEFENGEMISATEVRKLSKKGRLAGLRAA